MVLIYYQPDKYTFLMTKESMKKGMASTLDMVKMFAMFKNGTALLDFGCTSVLWLDLKGESLRLVNLAALKFIQRIPS